MRVFAGGAVRVTAVITVRKYEPVAYEEPATGRCARAVLGRAAGTGRGGAGG